jgi:metal-responsive CopG/Arc/MetJ family transcriptional regulator
MKIKVSISMEDALFEKVKQNAENSNGNFRNKSHLIEMAVMKFLEEKNVENKQTDAGGSLKC